MMLLIRCLLLLQAFEVVFVMLVKILCIVNQIIFHARLMNSNKNCNIKNHVIVLDN